MGRCSATKGLVEIVILTKYVNNAIIYSVSLCVKYVSKHIDKQTLKFRNALCVHGHPVLTVHYGTVIALRNKQPIQFVLA